ncbi:MAG: putative Ig domain-containing protein, partial [Candidatus Sericytochromatia bacterium]
VNSTDTDIAILTSSLAVAVNNQSYDPGSCSAFDPSLTNQLEATGGDVEDLDDYRWSISKGSLPSGMSLSSTTGRLTGTPSVSTPQVFTFTVKVRDDADNSTSKVFSLEVRDSAIYGFTPATGGQNLFVTLFGEGLSAADDVFFGQNHPDGVASTVTAVDTTDCDEVTTQVPVGAPIGLLSVRDAGDGVIGTTIAPFISENVVISEVFTNPAGTEKQYVELKNLGPSSVNLSGWFLSYTRIDGVLEKVPVPAQTLNANNVTVVDLQNEMRFDPSSLTRVALCKGFACDDNTVDLSRYRDYLQFGPAGDGGNLENNAVTAGLWTNDSTVAIDTLQTTLQDVDADPTAGDPEAHYGVRENSYNQSGLLLLNGTAEYTGYTGDAVLYYTPSGGAEAGRQQRIKRTVKGVGPIASGSNPDVDAGLDPDRVVFDTPFIKSTIQAANEGDGSAGDGILVDDLRFFSPGDFVNVLTGSAVRTITALSGRRIELDSALSADIQNYDTVDGNTSDGTTDDLNFLPDHMPGFRVGDKQAQFVSGNATVEITVHEDIVGKEFTVTRNVVSTPDADHIVVNQALATAPISGNTGDGNPFAFYSNFPLQFTGATPFSGSEITVTSDTNFFDNDRVLYNGKPCEDGEPCVVFVGTGGNRFKFRLDQPLARMEVADVNTGDGTVNRKIDVDDITGFSVGDNVLINGQPRTISAIDPAFTVPGQMLPRIQLNSTFVMSPVSANTGDGRDTGEGIQVSSAAGFTVGHQVNFFFNGSSHVRTITSIIPTNPLVPGVPYAGPAEIFLDNEVVETTVLGGNTNTGDGSVNFPLQLTSTTDLIPGIKIRLPAYDTTFTISSVNNLNNTVVVNPLALSPIVATLTAPAGNGTVGTPLNFTTVVDGDSSSGAFHVNDRVRFSNGSQIGQIASFPTTTSVVLVTPLTGNIGNGTMTHLLNGEAVTLVPTTVTMVPVGDGDPADSGTGTDFQITLVPKTGNFTLVPQTLALDPARILTIPTSGFIFFAPQPATGTEVRKYRSITFNGAANGDEFDYNITTAPTKGN